MYKFTIIIPVFQIPNIFELFLQSLKETIEFDTKIIFVNDGSSEETMSKTDILLNISGIEILKINHQFPKGCVESINEALHHIEGNYTVFMDSDIILPSKWQKRLLESFEDLDNSGAVGALLLYPQSKGIQNCGLVFAERLIKHLYFNNRLDFLELPKYLKVQSTVFAFCAVPNEIIRSVGFLDNSFFNGNEDVDYQLRIQKMGYNIFINTSIQVYHWEKSNGIHRLYNKKSNLATIWKKHGEFIDNDLWHFIKMHLNSSLTEKHYIVLDLSESRIDSIKFKNYIETNFPFIEWLDYSYLCSADESIKFAEILPIDLVRNTIPFIILCDNFTQLFENRYWLDLRKSITEKDIVVDYFGNVISLQSLSPYTWPGHRRR